MTTPQHRLRCAFRRFFNGAERLATVVTQVAFVSASSALTAGAVELNFQPVAPGVYAHIGDLEGRTYDNEALNANIGLIDTPAGAILVDSGASDLGAQQIEVAARKVTPRPIRWVINTGGQDHRWLGNAYFVRRGADVLAHASAQADMQNRGPVQLNALRPLLKEKLEGTQIQLPTRWVSGESNVLDMGGVAVHILHRAGGHTPGDSLVWLPQQGVVFTGDVVYVDRVLGLHPVSNTRHWLASFELLESLQPRVVVPGHGAVTTLHQAQKETRDLLLALRRHVGQALEAGTDLAETVKRFDRRPFLGLKHADVWLPQLVNHTYLEMERE